MVTSIRLLLAFILLLLWGAMTITVVVPLIFGLAERFSDWVCGGKRLLTFILNQV